MDRYAETNITINALAPAVIRTAMVEAMQPEQVKVHSRPSRFEISPLLKPP